MSRQVRDREQPQESDEQHVVPSRPFRSAGAPAIDMADAWQVHGMMAAYAYVAAVVTLGLGGLQDQGIATKDCSGHGGAGRP